MCCFDENYGSGLKNFFCVNCITQTFYVSAQKKKEFSCVKLNSIYFSKPHMVTGSGHVNKVWNVLEDWDSSGFFYR